MGARKWLTARWFRYIAMPIAAGFPSGAAALWFQYHTGSKESYWLKDYEPLVLGLVGVWAFGISVLKSYLNDFGKATIETLVKGQENLAHLFSYVRIVVGAKSRRFFEALNQLPDEPDPGRTFFEITRPDLQIKQLIQALYGYYGIDIRPTEEQVSVSLMEWNGPGLEVVEWFPEGRKPNVDPKQFSDAQSLAGLAYHSHQLVVSESMEIDGRYKRTDGVDRGSMFSYPVIDERLNQVIFVINVVSTRIGRFQDSENGHKPIRTAMDIFAERIVLENRLAHIKAAVLAKHGGMKA
jgi:hypothetical protein